MPKCKMAAKTALQVDSTRGMNTNLFNTCPRWPEGLIDQSWVVMARWVQGHAPNLAKKSSISEKNSAETVPIDDAR